MERIGDYDYNLPQELIAMRPAEQRDAARMLVLDRASGGIAHRRVADLPEFLQPGDLVVLNDSKVIRARLLADAGRTEVFLLAEVAPLEWECLVRPGRKFRVGAAGEIAAARYVVTAVANDGVRRLRFDHPPDLLNHGTIPLPPYIRRDSDEADADRYQTVFARAEGSVAAPTAGLHFTPALLERIPHAFVTLHVGAGTFAPVKTPLLRDHTMHAEHFSIGPEAAAAMSSARRLLAVGTTTTRVLESLPPGPPTAHSSTTRLMIRPPFTFQRTGALLTNFHLPRSTLLVLVCAFAGRHRILDAYHEAIRLNYRFYSYGDCMLIL
jgi:S-adenosylmethionine:tRNA ribosyltransferase-isomerase